MASSPLECGLARCSWEPRYRMKKVHRSLKMEGSSSHMEKGRRRRVER